MKYVLVKIGWRFYQAFLGQTHVSFGPSQWFSTHDCCSTKTKMSETQYLQSMNRRWCTFLFLFDLNYINIISALFQFTINSRRFFESLSSSITLCTSYDLAVLFVSIVSIHSLQLVNHVVGNEQKKVIISSTSDIIYWDEQHQMSYLSIILSLHVFLHPWR